MKRILLLISLMLSSVVGLDAQTFDCFRHPTDPAAFVVDTSEVTVVLASSESSISMISTIVVFRTSANKHDYLICVDSFHVTGTGNMIDSISTPMLFNLLGRATVAEGVSLGYTVCASDCLVPEQVRVYMPACVKRIGSGSTTDFSVCGTTTAARRMYGACCPNGSLSITDISSQGCVCPPGDSISCVSTVP